MADKPLIQYFRDGLVNIISNMGTEKDKRYHNDFQRRTDAFTRNRIDALYLENWVAAKVIDIVPDDMTREWRTVTSPELSPEEIHAFEIREDELDLCGAVNQALKWSRLYGTAAILPVYSDDGIDLSAPLDISKVRPGSMERFVVLEGGNGGVLAPSGLITQDPFSDNYWKPATYTIAGAKNRMVHHTHLVIFEGRQLPTKLSSQYQYGGQPIFEVLYDAINDAITSSNCTASLIQEANVDILSVEGLAQALAAGEKDTIIERYDAYHALKSLFNLVVVDASEQHSNRNIPLSNYDKVIEIFYDILAGATDIPATRLVSRSARGMNATGEGDRDNYYDMLRSKQKQMMRRPLHQLDKFIAMDLWGKVPTRLWSEFRPLIQEDPNQLEDTKLKRAQRDQIYLALGVIPEYVVAQQLQQDGTYDNLDDQYIDVLRGLSDEPPEDGDME